MFVVVVGVLIFSPLFNESSYAQPEGTIQVISSDSKIVFTVYTGLFHSEDETMFDFYLVNNNENPQQVRIVPSSLIIKDALNFSLAPSFIGPDQIIIQTDSKTLTAKDDTVDIGMKGRIKIHYIISKDVIEKVGYNEAVYEGQIQIIEQNMQTTPIDVEISFRDNPWYYAGFVLSGIGVALAVGWYYTGYEKRQEIRKATHDDAEIISHINGHIRSINSIRLAIDSDVWDNIYRAFNEKKIAIEKYRDRIELDENAEAVKWFETVDNFLRQKFLAPKHIRNSYPTNLMLPEIESPGGETYETLRESVITDRIKEQHDEDRVNWRKKVYLVGIFVISSFVAIITAANFLGNTWINIPVAISIGFALYRSKDLLKLFPSNKEE